jgi:hypothetical protein
MRKADYSALAMILSVEITAARRNNEKHVVLILEHIARSCADSMHVNKAAFLKACGLS